MNRDHSLKSDADINDRRVNTQSSIIDQKSTDDGIKTPRFEVK